MKIVIGGASSVGKSLVGYLSLGSITDFGIRGKRLK